MSRDPRWHRRVKKNRERKEKWGKIKNIGLYSKRKLESHEEPVLGTEYAFKRFFSSLDWEPAVFNLTIKPVNRGTTVLPACFTRPTRWLTRIRRLSYATAKNYPCNLIRKFTTERSFYSLPLLHLCTVNCIFKSWRGILRNCLISKLPIKRLRLIRAIAV